MQNHGVYYICLTTDELRIILQEIAITLHYTAFPFLIPTICNYALITFIPLVVNSQPKLKDLYNLITPEYATNWRNIGILLGIKKNTLDGIEQNCSSNVSWCCNELLEIWLENDADASWKKIIKVIDSSSVVSTPNTNIATASQQVLPGKCIFIYIHYIAKYCCPENSPLKIFVSSVI